MNSFKGFVLLMTLGIMIIMSLLVFISMQHVLLYYKVMNQEEVQHQHFYQLEHLANQLIQANHLTSKSLCIIHDLSANEVLYKLRHHEGCTVVKNQIQYRYFIHDFGLFPCLIVQKNNQQHATHHYGISLMRDEKEEFSALQLRMITLAPTTSCIEEKQFIALGISSWRYLQNNLK